MAWIRSRKKGSGGADVPKIVYAESQNRASVRTFTYTFLSSGKYQYYVWNGITSDASSIVVKLNGTVITPLTHFEGTAFGIFYNEIEVLSGDVLTAETTTSGGSAGVQFFLFQNADITQFAVLGHAGNNATRFTINNNGKPYLQVFQFSYQGTRNSFNYDIFQYSTLSIAVPNISDFYYGGTYAIAIK